MKFKFFWASHRDPTRERTALKSFSGLLKRTLTTKFTQLSEKFHETFEKLVQVFLHKTSREFLQLCYRAFENFL
jgi:hypothetical protein